MKEVALRELRNHTSDVLHRVEAGEELTVTVSGRPVAKLVPLPRRPQFLSWRQVLAHPADPGLADQLREMFPETVDDIEDPWSRSAR
ncbi:MAG: type II toxin-antitoxin system Phd/YefM family antitoxin [Kutzneria sp.]|nr:type II toxin-antitoxin system Phd/YefM family antitoxin [Kutzneria sp.]